jgi:hypothetical protein
MLTTLDVKFGKLFLAALIRYFELRFFLFFYLEIFFVGKVQQYVHLCIFLRFYWIFKRMFLNFSDNRIHGARAPFVQWHPFFLVDSYSLTLGKYPMTPHLKCYHATIWKKLNCKWQKMLEQLCKCSQDMSLQSLKFKIFFQCFSTYILKI